MGKPKMPGVNATIAFHVGPWKYLVKLSTDSLTDDVGLPVGSHGEWGRGIIWLNRELPLERRLDELLFTLAGAWEHHMGSPHDARGRASLMSSFAVDVWKQLQDQGGIEALACVGFGDSVICIHPKHGGAR